MSGHEGVLDMLVAVAQVLRQHSTEQLAKELTLMHAHPPDGHMIATAMREYLHRAETEAALATVVRHFEQVPRAWIDGAVAVTLDIAKEPYAMGRTPPRAGDAFLGTAGSRGRPSIPAATLWAPVNLERMQQLQRRRTAILMAIEKNNAAFLPADLQAKPES